MPPRSADRTYAGIGDIEGVIASMDFFSSRGSSQILLRGSIGAAAGGLGVDGSERNKKLQREQRSRAQNKSYNAKSRHYIIVMHSRGLANLAEAEKFYRRYWMTKSPGRRIGNGVRSLTSFRKKSWTSQVTKTSGLALRAAARIGASLVGRIW